MPCGLIGHTGFVGGNLLRQNRFSECFNSRNIEDIAGRTFDLLVCAGAPAEKWRANREPGGDRANLERLMRALTGARAREVVLISTVDVYPRPFEVDERSSFRPEAACAYGYHRSMLEAFVAERFETRIVRLPGLFGPGLKKNVVFDLLHGRPVAQVHADSTFQFYNVERLWGDVLKARELGLATLNVATEPLSVRELAQLVFGRSFEQRPDVTPARYDFRSLHARHWGGPEGYLYGRQQVVAELRAFVHAEGKQSA